MTFEFAHRLPRGSDIQVRVDAVGDDCIVTFTTAPSFGVHLENMLTDLWLEREKIEEEAWSSYQERLKSERA